MRRAGIFRPMGGRRGSAAVEFAVLAPVLIAVALSLYDATSAIIAWWRVTAAARAIDLIATDLAATPSLTNVLSSRNATVAGTAIYAVIPTLLTAPGPPFGVILTSVVFTPTPAGCSAGCGYTANVAWSATVQGSVPARPCGALSVAPDGSRPSLNTLPADAFSPAPILIADVVYQFTPLLTTLFAAPFTLREAAYLPPRTGSNTGWVRYSGPLAAQVQCPGYTG